MTRLSIFDAALPLGEESQVYWRDEAVGELAASDSIVAGSIGLDFLDDAVAIAPAAVDGDGAGYVIFIRLYTSGRVFLQLSAAPDYNTLGPDLTDEAERNIRICLQYGDRRLAVAIADDYAEPYIFAPSNAQEVMDFLAAWTADADRDAEPVKAAIVWGGAGARVDLGDFTTALPPVPAAAFEAGALAARGRLRTAIGLRAAFAADGLSGGASLRALLPAKAEFSAAALAGRARLRVLAPGRFERALRATSPADRLLVALEIRHPAVSQPVRVVNDTCDQSLEGHRFVALRFDMRLADDVEGRTPQAQVTIDNVGRELTGWLEAADGGVGATVRVMIFTDGAGEPEWEVTMDVAQVRLDQEQIIARLGYDPLLGRRAVTFRHDPETSPGLF